MQEYTQIIYLRFGKLIESKLETTKKFSLSAAKKE
jgi:hypothetical protein